MKLFSCSTHTVPSGVGFVDKSMGMLVFNKSIKYIFDTCCHSSIHPFLENIHCFSMSRVNVANSKRPLLIIAKVQLCLRITVLFLPQKLELTLNLKSSRDNSLCYVSNQRKGLWVRQSVKSADRRTSIVRIRLPQQGSTQPSWQ